MKKLILTTAILYSGYVAINKTKSDWRYPLLLITSLPKMVFRYFV